MRLISTVIRRSFQLLTLYVIINLSIVACHKAQEPPLTERAPAGVRWVEGPSGLKTPESSAAGPGLHDPVPRKWNPNAHGALLAAVNTQVYMAGAPDEIYPDVVAKMLENSDGAMQWAQARGLMTVSGETQQNPPEFVGFKFSEFTDDQAIIILAAKYPSEGDLLAAYPVQMSRSTGDWKAVVPTQDQAPDLTEITEDQLHDEFVAFGPSIDNALDREN